MFTYKCELSSRIYKQIERIFLVHLKGRMVHNCIDLLNYFGLTNHIAYTFSKVKGINRTYHNHQRDTRDMEDSHRTYNHEVEVIGLYVGMGNARIESNGHGEDKEESMNLVETIKSLPRYVLIYTVDNEKLMRA